MLRQQLLNPAFWILTWVSVTRALHFYLDASDKRCFIEELPTDTIVEGHYRAVEWSDTQQAYVENNNLGIQIDVEEMETSHPVVRTQGPFDGRFTFTSHEAGDHIICLSTNYTAGWFNSNTHIRLYLDIVVGHTKPNIEHDRSHVSQLVLKVRDLNNKLEDIKTEQRFQREREADYRNASEATNSRAVWYTVAQIVVLLITCFWQSRHLRRFFDDRKLR